jgi:hypothetical protein
MLLGLSPGAAIVAGAAESLQRAAGPPAALRAHTLALAVGSSPSAVAHRAAVLGRAGPFGRLGFPRPARTQAGPHAGAGGAWRHTPRGRAAVAAGAVLAVAIAVAVALAGSNRPGQLAGGNPTLPASAAAASAGSGPGKSGEATPAHPGSTTTLAPTRPASPTATKASATKPATTSPSPTPSKTPSPAPSPAPSRSPSPSTSPGTLQVSPSGGQLTVSASGSATITLTARGGPVVWSIAVSAGSGHVNVTPSGGTLRAGTSTVVSIQAKPSANGMQLTVSPGGVVFTIVTGENDQLAANLIRAMATIEWAARSS